MSYLRGLRLRTRPRHPSQLTAGPAARPRVPPPATLPRPDVEPSSNTRPAPSATPAVTGRDQSFGRESGPAYSKPVASKPVRAETGRGPEPKERAGAPSRRSRLNPTQTRWGPVAPQMADLRGRTPRPAANRHGDTDWATEPGEAAARGTAAPETGERTAPPEFQPESRWPAPNAE